MNGYGQVYWGAYYGGKQTAWRGILMDGGGRELWIGIPQEDPDAAFDKMSEEAKEYDITDLRRWSGDPAPIMETNARLRGIAKKVAKKTEPTLV